MRPGIEPKWDIHSPTTQPFSDVLIYGRELGMHLTDSRDSPTQLSGEKMSGEKMSIVCIKQCMCEGKRCPLVLYCQHGSKSDNLVSVSNIHVPRKDS